MHDLTRTEPQSKKNCLTISDRFEVAAETLTFIEERIQAKGVTGRSIASMSFDVEAIALMIMNVLS